MSDKVNIAIAALSLVVPIGVIMYDILWDWPSEYLTKPVQAIDKIFEPEIATLGSRVDLNRVEHFTAQSNQDRHNKRERAFWAAYLFATTVGLLGAFAAVYVAYRAFLETQRQADYAARDQTGWLAPIHLVVNFVIANHDSPAGSLGLAITFSNVGRSPSIRKIASATITNIFPEFPGKVSPYDVNRANTATSKDAECSSAQPNTPDTSEIAIWPSAPGPNFYNFEARMPASVIEIIQSGYATVRVNGCFVYESMQRVHHSWFCLWLEPSNDPMTKWRSLNCFAGNGGD